MSLKKWTISHLGYADDFNLFSLSMNGMQMQFTRLFGSSRITDAIINEVKTKYMYVFQKHTNWLDKLRIRLGIIGNGNFLKHETYLKILGILFEHNGSLKSNSKHKQARIIASSAAIFKETNAYAATKLNQCIAAYIFKNCATNTLSVTPWNKNQINKINACMFSCL